MEPEGSKIQAVSLSPEICIVVDNGLSRKLPGQKPWLDDFFNNLGSSAKVKKTVLLNLFRKPKSLLFIVIGGNMNRAYIWGLLIILEFRVSWA